MQERIVTFFKSNKYAIIWTACYVFIMWATLRFLFHFSMFSGADWWRLAHAHLRGFPGFVFGLMILAALPLYIATTAVIVRTGRPLVTVPVPKLRRDTATPETPAATTDGADTPDAPNPIPSHIPLELQAAFINARRRVSAMPWPPANTTAGTDASPETPAPTILDSGDMPLPPDFDIPFEEPVAAPSVPMFKEISFDEPDDVTDAAKVAAAPTIPTPTDDHNSPVAEYLKSIGRDVMIDGDLVISGDIAIATHADTDFWVADDVAWFASGKHRPSPVAALHDAAATRGLRPVLYLAATNIMDLDAMVTQWTATGIRVITDITELSAM